MNIKVTTEISLHKIACLLCNALEGGSNYWYEIQEYIIPTVVPIVAHSAFNQLKEAEHFPHLDYPLNEGGALIISDKEGNNDNRYRLDLESIKKGLQIMADKYPQHFANFISENDDADTGDCFLQCCLFGEIIYG